MDDVTYIVGILGNDDFSASNFTVFPNPLQDVLNIRSPNPVDRIEIYDLLGKLLLKVTPEVVSPSIDMSSLNSGAYLVKVAIGGAFKIVKVIK